MNEPPPLESLQSEKESQSGLEKKTAPAHRLISMQLLERRLSRHIILTLIQSGARHLYTYKFVGYFMELYSSSLKRKKI